MTGGPWDGIIFTPDNEPYLGRQLLKALDNLIIACLESNSKIARHTHQIGQRTDLQDAACVLIPQGVNLSLAIRELVRQGYLFAAKVLLRPLAERSVTILYLCENPAKMEIWNSGWSHRERPTLARMMDCEKYGPDIGRKMTSALNSLTHGDPASGFWNMIVTSEGTAGYGVSKNLGNPNLCDEICAETIPWLALLLGMMHRIFPEAEQAPTLPHVN